MEPEIQRTILELTRKRNAAASELERLEADGLGTAPGALYERGLMYAYSIALRRLKDLQKSVPA